MKNLKIFLFSFLIVSLSVWGINIWRRNLDYNFDKDNYLTAQLISPEKDVSDFLKTKLKNLDINAKSAILVLLDKNGKEKIIFQKNINDKLPIASLTKLMAIAVFIENFDINQSVRISYRAVNQKEFFGNYKAGEILKAKDLILSSIIESSNDAVYALAEKSGFVDYFVALMNLKAKEIGMENTYFYNPSGIEEDDSKNINISTAEDLSKLAIYFINNSSLLNIISKAESDIFLYNGKFHHKAITNNQFLKNPYIFNGFRIIGGKTGTEKIAGECLLLILENQNGDHLISVILNAQDRFQEARKIIGALIN